MIKKSSIVTSMKVCPKCGKIANYNSYFGAYLCECCDWEERIKQLEHKYISTHYGYCYYDLENNLIYNLYVYEDYRRKGYAKRLLQYVINEIRQSGYTGEIHIQANPKENSISKDNLVCFYKQMGLNIIDGKKKGENNG